MPQCPNCGEHYTWWGHVCPGQREIISELKSISQKGQNQLDHLKDFQRQLKQVESKPTIVSQALDGGVRDALIMQSEANRTLAESQNRAAQRMQNTMIDGFRHALLGVGDLSFAVSFGVAAVMALVLFCWAATLITRSYRLRN